MYIFIEVSEQMKAVCIMKGSFELRMVDTSPLFLEKLSEFCWSSSKTSRLDGKHRGCSAMSWIML